MIERRVRTRNRDGFTLVELLVVIAIIGILLTLATFAFHQWMVKSNVEAEVRQIIADVSQVRFRAQTSKQIHSMTVNANSYVFKSYSSGDEPASSGRVIPGGIHMVKYQLKKSSSSPYAGEIFQFNQQGIININIATYPNQVIPIYVAYTGTMANLDCVNIQFARISAGKTNATGDNCDDR
jgi:prepilin-type N-terminal cleavage/methylation domain-containing protein